VSLVAVQEAVGTACPDWAILLQAQKLDVVAVVIGKGTGLSLLPLDEADQNAEDCCLFLLGVRMQGLAFGGGREILGRS
jgi:hypothetical protein